MNLYMDFFGALPQKNGMRYHGGGYYTRNIIRRLSEYNDVKVILLCPTWYDISKENEPELYDCEKICWFKTDEISANIDFEKNSILFFPMLGFLRDLRAIVKVRKKNPSLKICATLHDVRFLEYTSDYTEKYYKNGLTKYFFPIYSLVVDDWLKKIIKRPALKKCIRALDEVYTVSNYSMQHILKEAGNVHISLYYQSLFLGDEARDCAGLPQEYILFVSGARPIKNLSHALIGFSEYKKRNGKSRLKLVVTGIDKKTFDNLCKIPGLNKDIIVRDTILFEYVSKGKLSYLYRNSRFVIYVSKNEGFGLPLLEAASYGKTSISSNLSAIPEVMGSAVVYVSPTDDLAIAKAIELLCEDKYLAIYEKRIAETYELAQKRMQLEQRNFIWDLLDINCINQ